ncbi:MAG TPA: YihY/virulence factor BrkB family protein [Kineosporiaceae bacterium]|nr:YihY/virulence factor BrkB family protein [Kineosporiaceae bacterium]
MPRTPVADVGDLADLADLTADTVRTCLRYRVTGLAAEAGFFALLSLPSFVLGLVASAGYVGRGLGTDLLGDLRGRLAELAATVLTPDVVHGVILRTFDVVVRAGRPEIVSLGFLLSVWSGSRALNVYLDTITIMYGLGGRRGIVRTRLLSLRLYLLALAGAVVVVPLLLLGPGLLEDVARQRLGTGDDSAAWVGALYWVVLVLVAVAAVTTLYHLAPPVRSPWRRCLPGAAVALGLWVIASVGLRGVVGGGLGGVGRASVYGPLAAPVALLVWFYLLALAVLIGAALNATIERRPAEPARSRARRPSVPASLPRPRRGLLDDAPTVDGRDAESRGDLGDASPVGFAAAAEREHEVGEPA